MSTTLEAANETLRNAVRTRLEATPADDPKMAGYKPPILAGCQPAMECAAEVLSRVSCCDGQRQRGDGLLSETYAEWDTATPAVHQTSQAFFDLCDALKDMHRRKSRDYGCPSGEDPLANIRNGAKFVGIPSWKGAMVRLSDKVTRLASYNATGRLENESLEDNLFDLASYSLLALLLHREERDG
jgi:hypothetical protein